MTLTILQSSLCNPMYSILRPLIFRLDPERAHQLTLQVLRFTGVFPPARAIARAMFAAPAKPVRAFGLTFPNAVGLAAGYDKDGLGWRGLGALGFGHVEVGTITPRAQAGNPKPRVFRLPEDIALINRMGFPGYGAEFAVRQVSAPRPSFPMILGVNIGKNKDTPNEEAAQDYLTLMDTFAPLADYLAVNVSSPNTVGLRRLQARDALESLLSQLAENRRTSSIQRPILVKLAPDLTDDELDDALTAIEQTDMDGVIATNTTIARGSLRSSNANETGGLSGTPLTSMSTTLVAKIYRRTSGKIPIVGVGGVMTPDDAKAKLDAGAALVQVFTGLIYAGPGLVKQIVRAL